VRERARNPSNRTKVKILIENFGYLSKKLVPRMLSHCGNVRTSKFWRKSSETKKKTFFPKIYEGHIRI